MGLVDAFTAEERVELKVSEVWNVLYTAAKIKADYDAIIKMLTMKDGKEPIFLRDQIEHFVTGGIK